MFQIKAKCLMFDWQAMVQKEQLGDELARMRERFEQYVRSSQTKIQQEREAARQENQFLIDDLNKKVGTQFSGQTQHIRSGQGSKLLPSCHFCSAFIFQCFVHHFLGFSAPSVMLLVLWWCRWSLVDVALRSFSQANTESSL